MPAAPPAHPVQHLDPQMQREALSRLLRDDWDAAFLIVPLVVEGADSAQVAAERGVSRPVLVEELRDAVGSLATRYARLANGALNDWPVTNVRPLDDPTALHTRRALILSSMRGDTCGSLPVDGSVLR